MSKPNTRRVIPRAAWFAIASGGICLLLSLPAQQAHAAAGRPAIAAGRTHGRSRVHRQHRNRAGDGHSPSSRLGTSAREPGHADGKREPSKSAHCAPRKPSARRRPSVPRRHRDTNRPGRHQPRGLIRRRSHADRARDFPAPGNRQAGSDAGFRRDSAGRGRHASAADARYRDGGTCSEQGGQGFRARHNRARPGLADAIGGTVGDAGQSPRRRHPGPR